MNFAAIDFETASSDRNSACSLGAVIVENGEITKKLYWLIRPPKLYFNPFNVMIHGITEEDVKDQPEFDELWKEIYPHIKGKVLIAHNASFDISVLRHMLDTYSIRYPVHSYFCSVIAARKTWPNLLSYKLNAVAEHLGIEFEHHNALEDAYVSASIIIEACRLNNAGSVAELAKKLQGKLGHLYPGGYTPASCSLTSFSKVTRAREIIARSTDFDVNHPCYNKVFVFTGTLKSMDRKEAMQKVADNGGICLDAVKVSVNYLVVGEPDKSKYKGNVKSSKLQRAEALIERGSAISIITEEELLKML